MPCVTEVSGRQKEAEGRCGRREALGALVAAGRSREGVWECDWELGERQGAQWQCCVVGMGCPRPGQLLEQPLGSQSR